MEQAPVHRAVSPLRSCTLSLPAPAPHDGRGAGSKIVYQQHSLARVFADQGRARWIFKWSYGKDHSRRGLR